jgi:hypothetical protein
VFVVRDVVRRPVAQLTVLRKRGATFGAFVALVVFASAVVPAAVTATPAAPQHPMQFTPHTPNAPVHTDFTVEVNGKGQVTRVRKGKSCPDLAFNAMTYGNALQTFIRTEDGRAIAGTYLLSYDFDPKTKLVRRSVALLKAGGVDSNRQGAVDEMAAIAHRSHGKAPTPAPSTSPLPDFKAITGHRH